VTTSASRSEDLSRDLTSWPVLRRDSGIASMAASQYDPTIERQRAALISAITFIAKNSINWSVRQAVPIERVSAETALAFVQRLPIDRAFPKIAPDGEGGVVLVWETPSRRALITCDGVRLLLVRDPGGPSSFHFSPMRFDGEIIPSIILENLPRR
jgi:hypothetical protein